MGKVSSKLTAVSVDRGVVHHAVNLHSLFSEPVEIRGWEDQDHAGPISIDWAWSRALLSCNQEANTSKMDSDRAEMRIAQQDVRSWQLLRPIITHPPPDFPSFYWQLIITQ